MVESKHNTYGTFFYDPITNGYEGIHPDDIEKMPNSTFGQKILYCIQEDVGYITLQYGTLVFRVKPDNYHPITDHVPFYMNDIVREKNREPEVIGRIYRVDWHFDRNVPMFFLEVKGKKKHRWYFENDLELIEKADANQG